MADKEKAQYNFKAFTDLFPGNNESMSSKSSKTDKKKIHLNTFDDITTKQKKVHFTQFKCLVKDSIVEISNDKVLLIQLDEFTVININTFTIDKRFSFLGMKGSFA